MDDTPAAVPAAPEPQPAQPAPAPVPRARDSKDILKSSDFYLLIGAMAGLIFLAAIVLTFVDRWRRRQGRGSESTPLTLSSFREMYENGEITQKEYERIRAKMAAKMKKEVGLDKPADPPPAVGTDAPPPQTDPPG